MIELGAVTLHDDESSTLTRVKLLGLMRALDAGDVLSTRVATGVSEIARIYTRAGVRAQCVLALDRTDSGVSLQITLEGPGAPPDIAPLRDITTNLRVERTDPHAIRTNIPLRTPHRLLTAGFIDRQRARVQQRSRRELMDELREKNAQLEAYNEALEQTVAERTAELRDANLRMRRDLEAGAEYVRGIIPEPIETPVNIDWRYIPSSDLGGDTIGYHWLDDRRLALYLLDVTGHGLDSALLAVTATNVVRSGSLHDVDMARPDQVVAALNDAFPSERHGGKFFTVWYGVYDLEAARLDWSGGGHHPSLLIEPGAGEQKQLESTGPLIGAIPGLEFPAETTSVAPGSRLLIFSDGVFEIINNGKMTWSLQEMLDHVAELARRDAPLLDPIMEEARRRRGEGPFDDDVSLIEVRFGD